LFQIINSDRNNFGKSLAFSDDGNWLAIASEISISLFLLDNLIHKYIPKSVLINSTDSFGYKIKFAYDETYSLVVGNRSSVYYYKLVEDSTNIWQYLDQVDKSDGSDFDVDQKAKILAITDPQDKILIYQRSGDEFDKDQSMIYEITNLNYKQFGLAVSLSENATYLAVTGVLQNTTQQRAVCIYKIMSHFKH